jgi:peptidase M28-like protein
MTRSLFTAFLLAASAPALAQPAPAPLPQVPGQIRALQKAALDDDLAWQITEDLTTEVGARLAGTEAEARARDWAAVKLRALGFSNVRIETFPITNWTRGAESAEILAPYPQRLVVAALGNSASTGPQGITGEVIGFDSERELEAAPDEAVRGKIVFVSHAMPRTQDGSGYGFFGGPRRQGPSVASRKGALGIVIRSIGTDYHRNPHVGVQAFAEDAKPIPAGALSIPDAEQLQRILARAAAKGGTPVTMHLTLVSQNGPAQSGNVIAEVPGRDPSLPPVLVGGHLDSWDLGTGAIDDAAGLAVTTAAAHRIKSAGRPLRTIRIVWFGSEEIGLFGGLDYQKRYGNQRHHAVAESDFGAGRVWKVDSKLGKGREDEARMLQAALAPLGIVPGSLENADGSDIGPLIAAGVPAVGLSQDGTHYFDVHHTPDDTLDKIDRQDLRQNVAAWTTMLAVLAGPIEPEPKRGKQR